VARSTRASRPCKRARAGKRFVFTLDCRREKLVLRGAGESCRPSGVAVMKSTDSLKGHDTAGGRRLNGARDRRIALERHMRAVLVVVRDMSSHEAEQMTLAEDDDVVQ